MAWGDPGLGKSDIAEAVAQDLGLDLIYADLATRDPAELAGIPWVRDGRTIRCRPDWLPDAGSGILFLDELPQAGIANLNIAATLIRDHRIGEHRLPPTWMVVCAGNHQHNRAGTTTMPSHVRNRLLHLDIDADANAWAQWASARRVDPMLIAYNRYRAQEYHHKFSPTDNPYPTPRTWTPGHQFLHLPVPTRGRGRGGVAGGPRPAGRAGAGEGVNSRGWPGGGKGAWRKRPPRPAGRRRCPRWSAAAVGRCFEKRREARPVRPSRPPPIP